MIQVTIWISISFFCFSCSSNKKLISAQQVSNAGQLHQSIIGHPVLSQHFTGFMLHDIDQQKDLVNINGELAFTPASNMKLLTYAAANTILGDSIPTIAYVESGDTLIIRGTGDPFHLGLYDQDTSLCQFLSDYKDHHIMYDDSHFLDGKYGSGWAWDDQKYAYNKVINALPLYDNGILLEYKDGSYSISPSSIPLKTDTTLTKHSTRGETDNSVTIHPKQYKKTEDRTWQLPMLVNTDITVALLSDACGVKIKPTKVVPSGHVFQKVYRHGMDSLYRDLLLHSDNYVAEQLMNAVSYELFDTIDISRAIDSIETQLLADYKNEIRWVDGSGLSRYNLLTPQSIISILKYIHSVTTAEERTFLLPHGADGTISVDLIHPIGDSLAGPYIFAKTGTLSNNHNLSGWITTQSGNTYLFSFMNNHFLVPKKEVVLAMSEVLSEVYWKM